MISGICNIPTDPSHVFRIDILFIGVYTDVYSKRLPAPNAAVSGLTPKYNTPSPVALVTAAKLMAWTGLKLKKVTIITFLLKN